MSDGGQFTTRWGFHIETEKLTKTEELLTSIKHRLDLIIGVEAVEKIIHFAEKFAEFGEYLHNASVNAGVSVEELQKLSYAAAQAGVSTEQMQNSMFRLGRMLDEAKKGSSQAAEEFAKAGFTSGQIQSLKNGEDALMMLADKIRSTEDPMARQAMAYELLGRNSRTMISFLAQGSQGIKKQGQDAKELGIVLSEMQVKSLATLNSSFGKLGALSKGVGALFASVLAPALEVIINRLFELYRNLRDVFDVNYKKWIEDLVVGVSYIIGVIRGLIVAFQQHQEELIKWGKRIGEVVIVLYTLSKIVDLLNGFLGIGIGIIGLYDKALQIKKSIEDVAKAIHLWSILQKGWNLLMSFGNTLLGIFTGEVTILSAEFWAVVGAVVAVIYAVQALYNYLKGGKLEDTWFYKTLDFFGGDKKINTSLNNETLQKIIAGQTASGGEVPNLGTNQTATNNNVNLSFQNTINTPPGVNGKDLGDYVASQIATQMSGKLDFTLRQAAISTKGSTEH